MMFWIGVLELIVSVAMLSWILRGGVERMTRPASELARDAFRYRWMRANVSDDMQWYLLGHTVNSPDEFDKAVDAAMETTSNASLSGLPHEGD